jgi:hypothetical protein
MGFWAFTNTTQKSKQIPKKVQRHPN